MSSPPVVAPEGGRHGRIYGTTFGYAAEWRLTDAGWTDGVQTFAAATWGDPCGFGLGLVPETLAEADIEIARARAELAALDREIATRIGALGLGDARARASRWLADALARRAQIAAPLKDRSSTPMQSTTSSTGQEPTTATPAALAAAVEAEGRLPLSHYVRIIGRLAARRAGWPAIAVGHDEQLLARVGYVDVDLVVHPRSLTKSFQIKATATARRDLPALLRLVAKGTVVSTAPAAAAKRSEAG